MSAYESLMGILDSLEYMYEIQCLRDLGLTEEEIEGYFEFFCDSETDLISSILKRETNVKH